MVGQFKCQYRILCQLKLGKMSARSKEIFEINTVNLESNYSTNKHDIITPSILSHPGPLIRPRYEFWIRNGCTFCILVQVLGLAFICSITTTVVIKNLAIEHVETASWFKETTTTERIQATFNVLDLNNLKYIKDGCSISPFWTNFGYCDDRSNVKECNYDNGDCCLPNIKSSFCEYCICHSDGKRHNESNIFIEFGKKAASKTYHINAELSLFRMQRGT